MDAAISLLSDHAVQSYFLILGIAIHRCIKIYFHNNNPSSCSSSHDNDSGASKGNKGHLTSSSSSSSRTIRPSILPLLLSAGIISITWYLILKFILTNLHTSTSYFDDAYKDVLRTPGHYFTSSQLLTWAIVAVVWTSVEGCDVAFLLFGFLGARC